MAARIYSEFPERKITHTKAKADSGSGSLPKSAPEHQQPWPTVEPIGHRFAAGYTCPRVKTSTVAHY